MRYNFELYALSDRLTAEQWEKLYSSITTHSGKFTTFEVLFQCSDNVVRFFVSCDKDLSSLSNNLDGILLRTISPTALAMPKASSSLGFVRFVTGGNILDLKERAAIKKDQDLQYAHFKVRPLHRDKAIVRSQLLFKNQNGKWSKANHLSHFFPSKLLTIDFSGNSRYLKRSTPKYLDIEKSLFMLSSDKLNSLFSVDTFPYFSHDYYLNLTSYEFDRHSFIIGASGSGKSKFISLFVDRLYKTALRMNYRVIIIDPHSSIAPDFAHIPSSKIVNFSSEGTELFAGAAADISAATELTATLFKSLMADSYNPKVDRLLRFSLFVLFTAQTMSLDSLKRFLTEVDLRNQVLDHVSGYVPTNIVHFFGADFNDMRTKYYNESISPLVSFVDEMQLQPVLVGEGELSLAKTIQDNFVTVFSLNKVSMGERVVKTVAGLLIQQIFLLAQARAFSEKILLIIDEVSIVQNPALASILAEARKFNLSVILTQQYFGQIDKDLRDAIFANVYNYYTFKVSEEDARSLEGNLNIRLPQALLKEEHKKGLKESDIRIKLMTELHPRECLVRVLANGQVIPAIKATTMEASTGKPHRQGDSQRLQNYSKAKGALPTKFKEAPSTQTTNSGHPSSQSPKKSAPQKTRKITIPKNVLLPQSLEGIRPFSSMQLADKPVGLFNLSELLAQHSSSRILLKKGTKHDT